MFKKITIQQRLAASMLFLGILLAVISGSAIFGLRSVNEFLKDSATNNVPSASALGQAQVGMLRGRLALDRVAQHLGESSNAADLALARRRFEQGDAAWNRYLALPQDAEEKALSDKLAAARDAFYKNGANPLFSALEAKDAARANELIMTKMSIFSNAISEASDALDKFQETASAASYAEALRAYERQLMIYAAMVLIGVLAAGFSWFSLRRAIISPLNQAISQFELIAAGDLTAVVDVRSQDEMGRLLTALRSMQEQLVGTIGNVQASGEQIASASHQIAAGNLDLSRRTEEQAASLEETASSMEEMTATVKHNAENAMQASQLATQALAVANEGDAAVQDVSATMAEIADGSKKVVDILAVIESIAFQTNILALNAAVEAARAGEQGRGFAVVASEVRSLAQKSASAAKDIKALTTESTQKVNAGTALVAKAGATMKSMAHAVQRVSDIMGEISAASKEQSTGIEQVNIAISHMDTVTQQNAALVEEAAAASGSLDDQAQHLRETVSRFRLPAEAQGHRHLTASAHRDSSQAVRGVLSAPARATKPVASRPARELATNARASAKSAHRAAAGNDNWETF